MPSEALLLRRARLGHLAVHGRRERDRVDRGWHKVALDPASV
jgi:hypothetical protein